MEMLRKGAVVAVAIFLSAGMAAPADAQQSRDVTLSGSVFTGLGGFHNEAPFTLQAPSEPVRADASTFFGVALEVGVPSLFLHGRARLGRTFGGDMVVPAGSVRTSCGPRCTQSEAFEESVGDVSLTTAAIDLRFAPFATRLGPYGFVGLARRTVDYQPQAVGLTRTSSGLDTQWMRAIGLGLDFHASDRATVWAEYAEHIRGVWPGGQGEPLQFPSPLQDYNSLTIGLRIRLDGGR